MGWRVNLFLYRLGRTIGWEEDYSDCWLFSIVVIVPDLILLSVTVFKTVFCFPVKTVSCFQITPKYVPKFHRKQFSVFNKPKTVFCFQQNSFFFYSFLFSNYHTREKQKNEPTPTYSTHQDNYFVRIVPPENKMDFLLRRN